MSPVAIPSILNEVAQAGPEGIPFPEGISDQRGLELCREWGVGLEICNGRVRLPFDYDCLVPAWIEGETPAMMWEGLCVAGYFQIGSTNEEALLRARQGACSGLLVYAETQTAGRGRKGRLWISSAHEGLYFSLILRPLQPLSCWAILTHVVSVALAQTFHDLYALGVIPKPLAVDLKWPNDVLLSGKKTAGILLEATPTGGNAHAAVIGVGINIGSGSVPRHLEAQATALNVEAGTRIPRRQVLVQFLHNLQQGYDLFERGEYGRILDQWKGHSTMWSGVPVWVTDEERCRPAVTSGLSESGALRIRTEDGVEETLLAGDVSIRRIR